MDILDTVLKDIAQVGVGIQVCDDLHAALKASGVSGNAQHIAEYILVSGAWRLDDIHIEVVAINLNQLSATLDHTHSIFLGRRGILGYIAEILISADSYKLFGIIARVCKLSICAEQTSKVKH